MSEGLKAVVTPILIPVDKSLCDAYRKGCQETIQARMQNLETKIDGLRSTIVTGLSISTSVIAIVLVIVNLWK